MNLVEKVQPSFQTGLVSNEYLLLNRPVWYEVRAYLQEARLVLHHLQVSQSG